MYKTNVIDTVTALPAFSRSVYEWLLRTGWYNFDGESGFSDVDSNDVAAALSVKPQAVNAAIGHLIEAGLIWTDLHESHGMKKVGRTYKSVVVSSFQIIYTAYNDGEPEHDDLLLYRASCDAVIADRALADAAAEPTPEPTPVAAPATQAAPALPAYTQMVHDHLVANGCFDSNTGRFTGVDVFALAIELNRTAKSVNGALTRLKYEGLLPGWER